MTTFWDESYPPSVLHPEPPPIVATGATAGSPGAWTPAGAVPPADLAAANALGYSGAAWTVGQYVVLGDASEAYWDGAAFVAGRSPVVEDPDGGEPAPESSSRKRRSSKSSDDA